MCSIVSFFLLLTITNFQKQINFHKYFSGVFKLLRWNFWSWNLSHPTFGWMFVTFVLNRKQVPITDTVYNEAAVRSWNASVEPPYLGGQEKKVTMYSVHICLNKVTKAPFILKAFTCLCFSGWDHAHVMTITAFHWPLKGAVPERLLLRWTLWWPPGTWGWRRRTSCPTLPWKPGCHRNPARPWPPGQRRGETYSAAQCCDSWLEEKGRQDGILSPDTV